MSQKLISKMLSGKVVYSDKAVEVSDDGRFVWKDQSFKSLSHTARAITGYNVSGFQFFGVRL